MLGNLKLGTKLLSSFLIVAALAGLLGGFGIMHMRSMAKNSDTMYEQMLVPLIEMSNVATKFQEARILMRESMDTTDPVERQALIEERTKIRKGVEEWAARLETQLETDKARKLFADFKTANTAYGVLVKKNH